MKTRIISGAVAVALLIAVLVVNTYWSVTAVIFIAVLAALAAYEMLYNTGCVKIKTAVFGAMIYSCVIQFSYAGLFFVPPTVLTILYVLFIVCVTLKCHTNFKPDAITMCLSMPVVISYAFSTLTALLNSADGLGLFYLVLLLNFSSVADCFAYFTGVAIGRHKLAPVISPKKTIEGVVGGVIGSVIGTVIICLIFNRYIIGGSFNILLLCLITPFMVAVGIVGDLFTSAIKRSYGIKDYGNLMPGHGGVLDRFDSILLSAPVLSLLLNYVEVIS